MGRVLGQAGNVECYCHSFALKRLAAGEKPSELAREFKISRMTLHRYRTKVGGGEG